MASKNGNLISNRMNASKTISITFFRMDAESINLLLVLRFIEFHALTYYSQKCTENKVFLEGFPAIVSYLPGQ